MKRTVTLSRSQLHVRQYLSMINTGPAALQPQGMFPTTRGATRGVASLLPAPLPAIESGAQAVSFGGNEDATARRLSAGMTDAQLQLSTALEERGSEPPAARMSQPRTALTGSPLVSTAALLGGGARSPQSLSLLPPVASLSRPSMTSNTTTRSKAVSAVTTPAMSVDATQHSGAAGAVVASASNLLNRFMRSLTAVAPAAAAAAAAATAAAAAAGASLSNVVAPPPPGHASASPQRGGGDTAAVAAAVTTRNPNAVPISGAAAPAAAAVAVPQGGGHAIATTGSVALPSSTLIGDSPMTSSKGTSSHASSLVGDPSASLPPSSTGFNNFNLLRSWRHLPTKTSQPPHAAPYQLQQQQQHSPPVSTHAIVAEAQAKFPAGESHYDHEMDPSDAADFNLAPHHTKNTALLHRQTTAASDAQSALQRQQQVMVPPAGSATHYTHRSQRHHAWPVTSLSYLSLAGCGLGSSQLSNSVVKCLEHNRTLRVLDLSGNRLSSEAGSRIVISFTYHKPHLFYFFLAGNPRIRGKDRQKIASRLRRNRCEWAAAFAPPPPPHTPAQVLQPSTSAAATAAAVAVGQGHAAPPHLHINVPAVEPPTPSLVYAPASAPPGGGSIGSAVDLPLPPSALTDTPSRYYSASAATSPVASLLHAGGGRPPRVVCLFASPLVAFLSNSQPAGMHSAGPASNVATLPALDFVSERRLIWNGIHASVRHAHAHASYPSLALGYDAADHSGGGARIVAAGDLSAAAAYSPAAVASALPMHTSRLAFASLDCKFATAETLRMAITTGADVLHISAHAQEDWLALETPSGEAQLLGEAQLSAQLLAGGGIRHSDGSPRVKLVVLAACRSLWAARLFIDAGVPFVVAINGSVDVLDAACLTFMTAFYSALSHNDTVKYAYDVGLDAVEASPECFHDEAKKFALLEAPKRGALGGDVISSVGAPLEAPKRGAVDGSSSGPGSAARGAPTAAAEASSRTPQQQRLAKNDSAPSILSATGDYTSGVLPSTDSNDTNTSSSSSNITSSSSRAQQQQPHGDPIDVESVSTRTTTAAAKGGAGLAIPFPSTIAGEVGDPADVELAPPSIDSTFAHGAPFTHSPVEPQQAHGPSRSPTSPISLLVAGTPTPVALGPSAAMAATAAGLGGKAASMPIYAGLIDDGGPTFDSLLARLPPMVSTTPSIVCMCVY